MSCRADRLVHACVTPLVWAVLALVLSVPNAWATDWFVRVSGSDSADGRSASSAFATMTKAMDAAQAGDTVFVGAGTYTKRVTSIRSGTANHPIRVIGDTAGTRTGDAGEVIVRVGGPVLLINNYGHLEFESLTLDANNSGPVVEAQNGGASVTLRSCTLKNAGSYAVYARNSGSAARLENCVIDGARLGGLYADNGRIVAIGVAMSGVQGYGMRAQNSSASIIAHRVSLGPGAQIGAHAENTTIYLFDSLIAGTTSNALTTRNGSAALRVVNSTIVDSGADAFDIGGGTGTLINCVVSGWSGYGVDRRGGTAVVRDSILYNAAGNETRGTIDSNNLLTDDPLLDSENRLGAGSPAIDAGQDTSSLRSAAGLSDLDLDGAPRTLGGGTDLGAYERTGAVVATAPYEDDFENGAGTEWSDTTTDSLPALTAFLGPFGKVGSTLDSITSLTIATEPGTRYRIEFDLYIFGAWDTSGRWMDWFRIGVDGTTLFDHTFHNAGRNQSYPFPPDQRGNYGYTGDSDAVFRGVRQDFTATTDRTRIDLMGYTTGTLDTEAWGVDNLSVVELVQTAADTPYFDAIDAAPGAEWSRGERETGASEVGAFLGRFATETPDLLLNTTPGTLYTLYFDAYLFDNWNSHTFRVTIDGDEVIDDTIPALGTPTLGGVSATNFENLAFGETADRVFRWVRVPFVANGAQTRIQFLTSLSGPVSDASFGLDNIIVTDDNSLPGLAAFWTVPAFSPSHVDHLDYADAYTTTVERDIAFADTRGEVSTGGRDEEFGILLTGLLDIPETGSWDFTLRSDDGSRLWIDGVQIIDNDGQHAPRSRTGTATLSEGKRRIEVRFYEWRGRANLELSWRGPGIPAWTMIPPAAYSRPMPLFIDSSSTSGFDTETASTDSLSAVPSLLFGDLNNDGRLDAIAGGDSPAVFIALPNGGYDERRLPQPRGLYLGAALFDADNDGDLDLWSVHDGSDRNERLYENTGSGAFDDLGAVGLGSASGNSGLALLDANLDGWTDVLMRSESGVTLGLNDGRDHDPDFVASFTDADLEERGLSAGSYAGAGGGVASGDLNDDGLVDFYSLHGGGALALSAVDGVYSAAPNAPAGPIALSDRGPIAFADYDNDGDLDLFVGRRAGGTRNAYYRSALYRNDGGSFVDVTLEAGLAQTDMCRSVAWGDVNHDGTLDLFLSIEGEPDRLYLNTGSGRFLLTSEPALASTTTGANALLVDADSDGDLDLAIVRPGERNALIENTLDNDRSLLVELRGAGAGGVARDAVGARVDLFRGTQFLMRRDVGQATGTGAQTPFRLHFGGVDPALEYTVRVTWPGGRQTEHPVTPALASATFGDLTIPRMLLIQDTEGGVPVRVVRWREMGRETAGVSDPD